MRLGVVWRVPTCLALVALILAACGGGDQEVPPTATSRAGSTVAPTTGGTATSTAPGATAAATPVRTAAATAAPTSGPRRGALLSAALPNFGTTESLDQNVGDVIGLQPLGRPIYDGLTFLDPDTGRIVPGLALRWEANADATAFTYVLRSGVKFSDGSDMTAEDVRFSAERFARPDATSNPASIWRNALASIEVVDATTIRFTAKKSRPQLPVGTGFSGGYVLSKAAYDKAGEKPFFDKPVGTGPWRLVRREPSSRYTYEMSPQKHPFREQPGFDSLELRWIPEETSAIAALKTGAIQIIDLSPNSIDNVKNSGLQIFQAEHTAIISIQIYGARNPQLWAQAPVSKPEVRMALALGVDRQKIVDVLLKGYAKTAPRDLLTPLRGEWDNSWRPYPYDPNRAKQLLSQAGYANGFTITYYGVPAFGFPFTQQLIETIAGYWEAIGVKTKIVPIDSAAFSTMTRKNPLEAELVGALSTQGSAQAANTDLQVLLGCFYASGVCPTISLYPPADNLYKELTTTFEPAKRIEISRRIIDMAFNDVPTIPLFDTSKLYGAAANIQGKVTPGVVDLGFSFETFRPK